MSIATWLGILECTCLGTRKRNDLAGYPVELQLAWAGHPRGSQLPWVCINLLGIQVCSRLEIQDVKQITWVFIQECNNLPRHPEM